MNQLRMLRRPEVLKKTGLSKTTIHYLEAKGQFPRHVLITPRCAAWDEGQVDEWLRARLAAPATPAAVPDQSLRRTRPGKGASR